MRITDIQHLDTRCTACTACASICPTHAIDMQADNEGFLYPVIREDACVHCGKCHKVCQLTHDHSVQKPATVAVAHGKAEDDRRAGSSGGIVFILSKTVLSRGGVVYGAVFDPQSKAVHHASSDQYSLESLSRSKYVQSALGDTFSQIQQHLQNGREVLFCGTPCQVTGLKAFLGQEYPGLLTVDFMCHGVPSPGLFRDTVREQEEKHGCAVTNVTFREKKHGWRKNTICFYFQDGQATEIASASSSYYWYFLHNYTLRKSCYTCDKYSAHTADLTVADYWQVDPKVDDDKGFSLVLKNTEKGMRYMSAIDQQICSYPDATVKDFSIYQHHYSLNHRTVFFDAYRQYGFGYVNDTLFPKEKKQYARWLKKQNLLAAIKNRCQKLLHIH